MRSSLHSTRESIAASSLFADAILKAESGARGALPEAPFLGIARLPLTRPGLKAAGVDLATSGAVPGAGRAHGPHHWTRWRRSLRGRSSGVRITRRPAAMLATHFSRFLAANPGLLHFAGAQPPSVARRHAGRPCALLGGFGHAGRPQSGRTSSDTVLPEAQGHVPACYSLSRPAPGRIRAQHLEFVARLYSCLDWSRTVRACWRARTSSTASAVQTGASRRRQASPSPRRGRALRDLRRGFRRSAASSGDWDLVWPRTSSSIRDSWSATGRNRSVPRPRRRSWPANGYHAFTLGCRWILSKVHARAFYLAGGYSTAMAG